MGRRPAGHRQRGQALPLFAIAFVTVVGFAGLALDGARLYAEHARLQSAADAAALGAAHQLRRGRRDYSRNLLPAAIHDASLQGVRDTEAEIVVNHPPVSGPFADSRDHVEVVVRADFRTTFMAMFGVGPRPVRGRAVAGIAEERPPCISVFAGGSAAYVVEGEQPFQVGCATSLADARDPFASLRMPRCVGRAAGSVQPADDSSETLYWPGCYEQPVAIGGGKARLMPGVHIFLGGLAISDGNVAGEGVSLLFPASSGQTGLEIDRSAQVILQAPVQGDFAGILAFAEAGGSAPDAILARGAGSDLRGALYFPGRTLQWAPNAPESASWTQAAAERLVILEAAGGRAVHPSPAGVSASLAAMLVE